MALVGSDTFPVRREGAPFKGDGGRDEVAGSLENKDHLSPQLKLQLGLG